MTAPAAIAGTYSDFKFIKSRSVCQIIVELPIEQADRFLHAFGAPQPGSEKPVAIALLDTKGKYDGTQADGSEHHDIPKLAGDRADGNNRAVGQHHAVKRAAILCKDPAFQEWIMRGEMVNFGVPELDAAEVLRHRLGIESRAELAISDRARRQFEQLVTLFHAQTGRMAEQRG